MNKRLTRPISARIFASIIFCLSLVLTNTSATAQIASYDNLFIPVNTPPETDYLDLAGSPQEASRPWVGVYCQDSGTAMFQCKAQSVTLETPQFTKQGAEINELRTIKKNVRVMPSPPLFAVRLNSAVVGPLKTGHIEPPITTDNQKRYHVTFNGSNWQLQHPDYFPESLIAERMPETNEVMRCSAKPLFEIQISNDMHQLTWRRDFGDTCLLGPADKDDVIELLWIGDIDGDSLPDVLLKMSDSESDDYRMLLSSNLKQEILFSYKKHYDNC